MTSPRATLLLSPLQIEVTERVLMEASNSAMSGLEILRAGVRVGLDDFGTGYSSPSYLGMFPLDFVKIDQSFIAETRWEWQLGCRFRPAHRVRSVR